MHFAAQRPGPADHLGVHEAYRKTVANTGVGAKFSLGNPKTEVGG